MKYINELVYVNQIAQAKHLAKDKKQKNKYRQVALLNNDQNINDTTTDQRESLPSEWAEDDRRTGEDRRKDHQERGRYVESRLEKNRRDRSKLSLKV